tara:strand:- start:16 stop:873 length:858 start_codon:yes stop_codon:yes gene_type:complete
MAIIYSYPEKTSPAGGDFLVITDSEQAAPNKNRTKSLTIDNLASYVATSTSIITGSGTLNTIAMFTPDGQKVGDSKITQSYDFINYTVSIDAELEIGGGYPTGTSIQGSSIFSGLLSVNSIVAADTGTVSLLGDTVIGNAGTDTLTVNAETTFADNVTINGNLKSLKMGVTSPLIFVDGGGTTRLTIGGNITGNSIINESGSGDLILVSNTEVEIKSGELGENYAKFTKDGPIELYYDNVKKFETASNSIKILDVPVHADNAAALAAGLTVGEVYRTGDLLKIVH